MLLSSYTSSQSRVHCEMYTSQISSHDQVATGFRVESLETSADGLITMQQPQIILLREGTDTSQGTPQLISNINACMAVVDTVRTTLGPRGMDKLVHDDRVSLSTSKIHLSSLHSLSLTCHLPETMGLPACWQASIPLMTMILFAGKSDHLKRWRNYHEASGHCTPSCKGVSGHLDVPGCRGGKFLAVTCRLSIRLP